MNLTLDTSELAILTLHMNIMRHNIKRGFKSNYGGSEGRDKLKVFDSVKTAISDLLDEEDKIDEVVSCKITIDDDEFDMLHSFVNWYVEELKLSAECENCNYIDDETITILENINKKLDSYTAA